MPLDKDRLAALNLQTEGLRYAPSSLKALKVAGPPKMPRVSPKNLADDAESVAQKFEKLAADVNAAWDAGSRLHDKLWSSGLKLDDVPERPKIGDGYSAGEDVKNDLISIAGWFRVTAAKLREAPKVSSEK